MTNTPKALPLQILNAADAGLPLFVRPTAETFLRLSNEMGATLTENLDVHAKAAFDEQGRRAFEFPKDAAAMHESAHAVFNAACGLPVTLVKICSGRFKGQLSWIGVTDGPAWKMTSASAPEYDLMLACTMIAGLVGERAYMGDDFRAGSSLGELVLFEMITGFAAHKLGVNAIDLRNRLWEEVAQVLERHADAHRAIAAELMERHSVKGQRLQRLLAPVRRSAENADAA